jgi:hypothetical protein
MLDSPYAGLMPFSEEQAPFFFGRDTERELIIANLTASRFTLLYGSSGVGKSSVLNAGVAYRLRRKAAQNRGRYGSPELAAVVFTAWRDDPLGALESEIRRQVGFDATGTFAEKLQAWSDQVGGDLYVILDQFEEYFLYQSIADADQRFADALVAALSRDDVGANFLISMREDSVARLDRFKGRIPNPYDNYLRIDHLDEGAARAAITKPIFKFNELLAAGREPIAIEDKLVDEVVRQVAVGRVLTDDAGVGTVRQKNTGEERRVQTPYLQLVMTRLWEEEERLGSTVLRADTFWTLGGAKPIVRTHLDQVMNALSVEEKEIAASVFHHLVTESGTKIAHTVTDLASYARVDSGSLLALLEKLSSGRSRILTPVAPAPEQQRIVRYQIFHDVLADPVLRWRREYVQSQEIAERDRQQAEKQKVLLEQQRLRADKEAAVAEEQRLRAEQAAAAAARLRRLSAVLLLVAIVATVATVLAFYAFVKQREQRDVAEQQRVLAEQARAEADNSKAVAVRATDLRTQIGQADSVYDRELKAEKEYLTLARAAYQSNNAKLAEQLERKAEEAKAKREQAQRDANSLREVQQLNAALSAPPTAAPTVPVQISPPSPGNSAEPEPPPIQAPPPVKGGPSEERPARDPDAKETATMTTDLVAGVLQALKRYEQAYDSLSVEQLQAVYPAFSRGRDLAAAFQDLKRYDMTITPGPIDFLPGGMSAKVTCRIDATFQAKVSRASRQPTRTVTFFLERRGDEWVIASIQA